MAVPYPSHDLSGVRTQVTTPHPTMGEACSPALNRHCLPAKPCCLLASLISGGKRSIRILNILRHAGELVSKGGSTLPWSPSRSRGILATLCQLNGRALS